MVVEKQRFLYGSDVAAPTIQCLNYDIIVHNFLWAETWNMQKNIMRPNQTNERKTNNGK